MNIPLLAEPIENWNMIQKQFVSWCLFYYNISQMTDPPHINLVNDDRSLDSYLQARELKIRKEKIQMDAEAKKNKGSGGHSHEVFR